MGGKAKKIPGALVPFIAMSFVLFFAVVWIIICVQVLTFHPTPKMTSPSLSTPLVVVGGFLATTVGAGTAAVLGVTVGTITLPSGIAPLRQPIAAAISSALSEEALLTAGVVIYFLVGILVLATWIDVPKVSPQMIETFALGVLGWAAGSFSGVFKAQTTS